MHDINRYDFTKFGGDVKECRKLFETLQVSYFETLQVSYITRWLNCSTPIPLSCSPGLTGKMCVIKNGGALENEVKKGGHSIMRGLK